MIYIKVILGILVSFSSLCSIGRPELSTNSSNDHIEASEVTTPEPLKDQYINEKGWEIPVPRQQKFQSTRTYESETFDGKLVKVTAYNYSPAKYLFTSEPFKTIGRKEYGVINISLITELKVNNKTFCYWLLVSKTTANSEGKLNPSGTEFTFRYIDMDGDSKFETLIFGGENLVPNWVSK